MSARRGFHAARRELQVKYNGDRAVGFGLQCGYWPCFKAPYVSLCFLFWRFDAWFGYPIEKKVHDYQRFYRRIVDAAWNAATESAEVPSTDWADRIIATAAHLEKSNA